MFRIRIGGGASYNTERSEGNLPWRCFFYLLISLITLYMGLCALVYQEISPEDTEKYTGPIGNVEYSSSTSSRGRTTYILRFQIEGEEYKLSDRSTYARIRYEEIAAMEAPEAEVWVVKEEKNFLGLQPKIAGMTCRGKTVLSLESYNEDIASKRITYGFLSLLCGAVCVREILRLVRAIKKRKKAEVGQDPWERGTD